MGEAAQPSKRIGRYELYGELASGGMASVHLGRLTGAQGFSRTVAIKRMHPNLAKDRGFRNMFVDEARLAARIRHPNVVSIIDVVQTDDEIFLVMEFVQGVSLHRLMSHARRRGVAAPVPVAVGIVAGALHGLHAAHEAKGDHGEPLHIVHRDVSPQNIMIGADGVPRVLDFGIAKAKGRLQSTTNGQVKGKFAYIAPEQAAGEDVGREADVYAAGVVLWEALAGKRLFRAQTDLVLLGKVMQGVKESPRQHRPDVPEELDALVMKAVSKDFSQRFASARDFALALEESVRIASASQIGLWVEDLAHDTLENTALLVAEVESQPSHEALRRSDRPAPSTIPAPPHDGGASTPPPSRSTTSPSTAETLPSPAPQESSSGRYALLGVIGIIATAALVIALRRGPDVQPAPPPAAHETGAVTVAATPAPPSPSPPEPPAIVPPAPPPIETATAKSGVAKPAPPRPRSATATATPAAPTAGQAVVPPPSTARAADCDPPYTLDSRGVQRIKPQCL